MRRSFPLRLPLPFCPNCGQDATILATLNEELLNDGEEVEVTVAVDAETTAVPLPGVRARCNSCGALFNHYAFAHEEPEDARRAAYVDGDISGFIRRSSAG